QEGDAEGEQQEQVEVAQREGPSQIAEPEQEEHAEAEPHRKAVDLLAAERARVAARHLPRHLRPRPGFGDGAARVVDLAGRDLAGRPRPDLDRPELAALVEGRLDLALLPRVV